MTAAFEERVSGHIGRPFDRFQRRTARYTNRLASAAILSVCIGVLFFPRAQEFVPRSPSFFAGFVLGLLCTFALLRSDALSRTNSPPRVQWLWGLTFAAFTGLIAFVVGRALSYDFGWDARVVLDAANTLAAGKDLDLYPYDYFSRAPNNVPLLALDRVLVSLASVLGVSQGTTIAAFNASAVALISLAVFAGVKSFGHIGAAYTGQAFVILLFGFSSWLAVPYTDLPVATLIALSVCCWINAERLKGRISLAWSLVGLSGVFAGMAIVLKPTSAILLVAIAISLLLSARQSKRTERFSQGGAAIAIALLISTAGSAVLPAASGLDAAKLDSSREFPIHHFARIGMLEIPGPDGVVRYGGYSADAVREMGEASSVDERKTQSLEAIRARLESLGPVGYTTFLAKKAIWIWSDGTFGAWTEGIDDQETLLRDGPVSRGLQSVLHPSGPYWKVWSATITGIWLSLLLTTAVLLWRQASRPGLVLLSLCILGIGAFTLFFEGRARYLIIFVPVLLIQFSSLLGPESPPKRRFSTLPPL